MARIPSLLPMVVIAAFVSPEPGYQSAVSFKAFQKQGFRVHRRLFAKGAICGTLVPPAEETFLGALICCRGHLHAPMAANAIEGLLVTGGLI